MKKTCAIPQNSSDAVSRLLAEDEPLPLTELRRNGKSSFVFIVDHASRLIPRKLGALGLAEPDLVRHIAWDIGCLAVARLLSEHLDAPLVAQNYSRLVIDCNRPLQAPSSIPTEGDNGPITGNIGLSPTDIAARQEAIFHPYHDHIRTLLDARQGRPTILIALHSMTDNFKGARRPMHAALLYNRDRRFAGPFLAALRRPADLLVTENDPYSVSDESDYTIPEHGEARGLPHLAIEMRQDLVGHEDGQRAWASRLAVALGEAETQFWRT